MESAPRLEFWLDYCSRLVPGWREKLTGVQNVHNLPRSLTSVICLSFEIHFSVQSLEFENINCLKFNLRILVGQQKSNVARVKWPLFDRLWQIMQISKPWNSHAGLAPEASNIPNEIQVLNWGLIWSLHYSSDEQIIEMITKIKFAIVNLLIH